MMTLRTLKKAALLCAGGLFVLNIALPPPLDKAYDNSVVVTDRNDQWLSAFPMEGGTWRLKADLDRIDPTFITYLLAIEDKRFYRHSGVDPLAVGRAARSWKRHGRAVSGASTLTMQLVRQLEPRRRNLGSKAVETLRAMQIEVRLSKDEILALYLTHVPYGGNIEGIEAASLAYFDKHPDQLTAAESALLIALPQAPEARRPDRHPVAAKAARDKILDKLFAGGLLSDVQLREAKEEPVPTARTSFRQTAWLAGRKLKGQAGRKSARFVSTIDGPLQDSMQRLAADYTSDKTFNTAFLVIENETMKVRVHVGSAGRDRPGGWIDMTGRARSPGSTLKPFIYGFAFDDGLSAPGSFIMDAPTRFGTYQPENFNRRYHGDVRIHEALAHSLNVPAVIALDQVGTSRFETALELGGTDVITPNQQEGKAGLALALGGAGLKVEDLAVLYAALANGGVAQPLVWGEAGAPQTQYRFMQQTSAAKITHILRQAPTPDGRVPHWLTKDSHAIAYKTGTSYGFRDAWAAGYTDKWTVIVWTGRPDGAPRVGQTGRMTAAPLLFDLFALLPDAGAHTQYEKIEDAPRGLQTFGGEAEKAPILLFPPDGAEIAVSEFGPYARGLTLAARSTERSSLNWYVEGAPVTAETFSGEAVWRPEKPGFYKVSVVDNQGRTTSANVRVIDIEKM